MASLMVLNSQLLTEDDAKNWLICTPEALSANDLDSTKDREMSDTLSTGELLG
ncbi:hypothetical protein [Vibrio hangzhouensis]|uniref:Uncharacterized protein n=1 Tax=Vibrio hangzhouensis TaxID=462991 RepID=A0A1H5Z0H3_9VIBR|nr:hypothetical protein [Vibrio hangzhouensis]SEG30089.1 hypothetical protein SAMN04488244_110132 [Vibrio hangzhouensis]